MKKLFLCLVLSLIYPFSQHLWAEHANFVELSLDVPDGVEAVMDSSNYVMSLSGNNAEGVLVTFGDPSISPKVDYDRKRVLLSFDTICFNLKGCDLLTEATDEGADYSRVMSRRLYRNRRDTTEYATTYTFVTPNRPYAFLFFHKGADLPDSYESIISSIDNNVSFGSDLWYQLKNGWHFILGLAIGAAVFAQIIGWFCDRDRHAKAIATLPFIVALSVFDISYSRMLGSLDYRCLRHMAYGSCRCNCPVSRIMCECIG